MFLAFGWSSAGTWKANTSAKGSTSTSTVTSRPVHQPFASFGAIRFVSALKVIWTSAEFGRVSVIVIQVRASYWVREMTFGAAGMPCNSVVKPHFHLIWLPNEVHSFSAAIRWILFICCHISPRWRANVSYVAQLYMGNPIGNLSFLDRRPFYPALLFILFNRNFTCANKPNLIGNLIRIFSQNFTSWQTPFFISARRHLFVASS